MYLWTVFTDCYLLNWSQAILAEDCEAGESCYSR